MGRDGDVVEIAPWWPFAPGPLSDLGEARPAADGDPAELDRPDSVLGALEELDVTAAGLPFRDLLLPAYEQMRTELS